MRLAALALILALAATPVTARRHERAKPKPHAPTAPAGTTAVPAGGLKVHCAGSKTPLLVRKFTQGSGTTVTVLCR